MIISTLLLSNRGVIKKYVFAPIDSEPTKRPYSDSHRCSSVGMFKRVEVPFVKLSSKSQLCDLVEASISLKGRNHENQGNVKCLAVEWSQDRSS